LNFGIIRTLCPSLHPKHTKIPRKGHACRFIEDEAEDEDSQSSDDEDNDCATKEDEDFIDNEMAADTPPHPLIDKEEQQEEDAYIAAMKKRFSRSHKKRVDKNVKKVREPVTTTPVTTAPVQATSQKPGTSDFFSNDAFYAGATNESDDWADGPFDAEYDKINEGAWSQASHIRLLTQTTPKISQEPRKLFSIFLPVAPKQEVVQQGKPTPSEYAPPILRDGHVYSRTGEEIGYMSNL
jgi:hypothetical protein